MAAYLLLFFAIFQKCEKCSEKIGIFFAILKNFLVSD